MSIGIIGAGAFGTALAISLAENGPVLLWARDPAHAAKMQSARENTARLPNIKLPDNITVTSEIALIQSCQTVLLSVPMQKLRDALTTYEKTLAKKSLVACCKGIELQSGLGPIAVLNEVLPDAPAALLTGPSFAADVAKGLPTALTLAHPDVTQGHALQNTITTSNLRVYRTTDTVGAELGGALKNVIAIGCGAVMGAGMGESARAALMTRGYAEMQRLALELGAKPETLAGLSGFGDLTLTCSSALSRNYRLGLSLGKGEIFDPSITVEGAATARAVAQKCEKMGLDMPITHTVVGLLDRRLTIEQAAAQLLARPLREE